MRIVIIGSTQYQEKFQEHKAKLIEAGHEVKLPAFDVNPELDEIGICDYNLKLIKWADEVHIIWDKRSAGLIFDFGMAFALNKPIKIIYLEPKTFEGVMIKYEWRWRSEKANPDKTIR